MIEMLEPINVWVFFKKAKAEPYVFFWKERRIKIDQINLMHTSKEGAVTLYHYSVSSGGNFYRLRFDSKDLKWFLEAVEEDG